MSPAGQETELPVVGKALGAGVQETVVADDPLTNRLIASTVTGCENVTFKTTCVAVAPPPPDWFVNLVIETESFPAVNTCGCSASLRHDAYTGGFAVRFEEVVQMLGLAAVPPPARIPITATAMSAAVIPKPVNDFRCTTPSSFCFRSSFHR
jgi:hypothetical protein